MAEPFDSNGPGDETRRKGMYVYGDAAEALYPGEAVYVSGTGPAYSAVRGNGQSDQVAGVVWALDEGDNVSGTNNVTVKTYGTHIARVEPDASVGDTVGTHDGTSENVEAGELSVNGDEYLVLDVGTKSNPNGGSDQDYAEVLKL
jgi:hypothetical protein